ncbi:GTPase Era [Oligoflexus tunisiensis]|uniref:GTPase Era n=1 Tax=Oligoflexus tunisiensis TaxID=708132 RepID=UPI000AFE0EF1|nr:GTPase Era [Oligoflexus tunisiensis]
MTQRCGYCAIMGRPNAGKSSLLNTLVGQKIVGVSAKPNTTRNRILGIRMEDEAQLLFLDTPGIHRSHKKLTLNSMMNREAWSVLADADMILYVIDVQDVGHAEDINFLRNVIKESRGRVLVCLNKCDKLKKVELRLAEERLRGILAMIREELPPEAAARLDDRHPWLISAKRKESLTELVAAIGGSLPEGPWLYPDDDLTDRPQKFVCAELIREQAFRHLGAELPYQLAVRVDTIEFKPTIVRVEANIVVSRQAHRGIVLGKNGQKIKEIGMEARQSLELHFQNKVFLGLEVIVDEDWVNDPISIADYADLDQDD